MQKDKKQKALERIAEAVQILVLLRWEKSDDKDTQDRINTILTRLYDAQAYLLKH